MKNSSSLKSHTLVDQQLSHLHQKRKDIARRIGKADDKMKEINHLKRFIYTANEKREEVFKELQVSSARYEKLKNKLENLQNEKVNLIIKLQNSQFEIQDMQKKAVQNYSQKQTKYDQLRLQLIDIESSQELSDLSDIFSLRKVLIQFILTKSQGKNLNIETGIENIICEKKWVDDLNLFFEQYLAHSKLSQFKMVILKPVHKYMQIMKKIEQFLFSQYQKEFNIEFNEEKAKMSIVALKQKQKQLKEYSKQIKRKTQKIKEKQILREKYVQYIAQLTQQKQQFDKQIQKVQQNLLFMTQSQKDALEALQELKQIDEAINYLFNKKSEIQNINYLNNSKSCIIIEDSSSFLSIPQITKTLQSPCSSATKNITKFQSPQKNISKMKSPKMKLGSPAWK